MKQASLLMQGDIDSMGRLVLHEVRGAPFVLKDPIGIMVIDRSDDGPGMTQFVLGRSKKLFSTFDEKEFLTELAKVAKGARVIRYDKCTTSLVGNSWAELDRVEKGIRRLGLKLDRDVRITCVCSQYD